MFAPSTEPGLTKMNCGASSSSSAPGVWNRPASARWRNWKNVGAGSKLRIKPEPRKLGDWPFRRGGGFEIALAVKMTLLPRKLWNRVWAFLARAEEVKLLGIHAAGNPKGIP